MSPFGPSPTRRVLLVRPQASSIRAEVAGQWTSLSMASYNDAMMRSYASWLLMTILPSQTPG